MSPENEHSGQEHWHEHYSHVFSWFEYFGNINAHRALMLSILKEKPKSVLEVGSGSGTMAVFLSYFVKKTVSIDNNKEVLGLCREHNKKFRGKAEFIYADAFKLPFKDKEFDIAYSQGFFEHFSKKQIIQLIGEQLRVAKKVVISVPNSDYKSEGVGEELRISRGEWEGLLRLIGRPGLTGLTGLPGKHKTLKILESRNYGRAALNLFLNKPGQYLAKITEK